MTNFIPWFDALFKGMRGYSGDTSEQFVIGPEFCGGALSKGGNAIAANSDRTGGVVSSTYHYIFYFMFIDIYLQNLILKTYLNFDYFSGNIFLVQAIAGGITLDTAIADDDDAVQYSANAPITGFSIRYNYVFQH